METLVIRKILSEPSKLLCFAGDVNDKLAEMIGSKQRYNMMVTYQYGLGELDENGEMKVNIKVLYKYCKSLLPAYGDKRLWIYC